MLAFPRFSTPISLYNYLTASCFCFCSFAEGSADSRFLVEKWKHAESLAHAYFPTVTKLEYQKTLRYVFCANILANQSIAAAFGR